MAEVYKETSKLDGVPILQTVVMGAPGQPGQAGAASGSQQPAQQQSTDQQSQDQQKPSIGGALGGALGGKFGLGRKKSTDSQQPSSGGQQGGSGSLLEMTTELTGFSADAVDEGMFSIPGGFKKVEPKHAQYPRGARTFACRVPTSSGRLFHGRQESLRGSAETAA